MKIQVLFFASLREALGTGRETLDLPASLHTVGELRAWLAQRPGSWGEALGGARQVRAAIDQEMVHADAPLHEGAEVAFFPPVTGG